MTMVEQQQYLPPGLTHPESLPGAPSLPNVGQSSASAPALTTSAYPDLTPYSAVSSFNLPTQCDSSLLTPTSAAGSPPLHQTRKLVHQYPPPPGTPGVQQPTPPGSSKMYHGQWTTPFDMNGQSSQANSPMAAQHPVVHQEFMEHYIPDGRRTPIPPEPYMGAFGVSDNPESHTITSSTAHPFYMGVPQVDHNNHMLMRESQPMPMGMPPRNMPAAPLLNEPHPSQFRQHRRPSADEHNSIHGISEESRSNTGSPRRRNTSTVGGRVKKRPQKSRNASARNAASDDPVGEYTNCLGQEVPPTLKASCPDEERLIFESRWKHRHQKGQDMWESIQSDYQTQFQTCPGKEMLQMKFKRGRSKYIEWLPKDSELLNEAWKMIEKDRYQLILEKFLELGGSRNMRLNASDIEVKVVNDLKLEEDLYIDPQGDPRLRRRVRSGSGGKKRSNGRGTEESDMPMSDEMMSVSSHNTHEDDVINQVYGRQDVKWEEDSSGGGNDVMDMQMWDPALKIEPHRDERVARQPCEQMMRVSPSSQPMYGRRS